MGFWRGSLPAAATTALCACSDGTSPEVSPLDIVPVEQRYSSGDTNGLTFQNSGTSDIGISTCEARLQHFEGTAWLDVNGRDMPNCGDMLILIRQGASRTGSLGVVPSNAPTGTYRYQLASGYVADAQHTPLSRASLTSGTFLVQ
jgi:hypothetical protein